MTTPTQDDLERARSFTRDGGWPNELAEEFARIRGTYEARVTELLDANNRFEERARAAERTIKAAHAVITDSKRVPSARLYESTLLLSNGLGSEPNVHVVVNYGDGVNDILVAVQHPTDDKGDLHIDVTVTRCEPSFDPPFCDGDPCKHCGAADGEPCGSPQS